MPKQLDSFSIPIIPSVHAGWFKRKKSDHFKNTKQLLEKFIADMSIQIDSWFLSSFFSEVSNVSIQDESDCNRLASEAESLFKRIQEKYNEHNIKQPPYIFLKDEKGTYGMGVLPIYHPEEILKLNRKARNKLSLGKSGVAIDSFLLQEGIYTNQSVNQASAESVLYFIGKHPVSTFYRYHDKKGNQESLNSAGMNFSNKLDNNNTHENNLMPFLARLARIAASQEIDALVCQSH